MMKLYPLCVLFLLYSITAFSQNINPPVYTTDGDVYDLHASGDTLIVAGDFTHAGKYTGGMALFTTASDQPSSVFPRLGEDVVASTPDGSGGFYFLTFDGVLKHVLANNSIDPNFNITATGGSTFHQFDKILYHNGVIYVGGEDLSPLFGAGTGFFIGFDVANQQKLSSIPYVNGPVKNMKLDNDTLYICGNFDTVGTVKHTGIAAIETVNKNVSSWEPSFPVNILVDKYAFHNFDFYNAQVVIGGYFQDTAGGGLTIYKAAVVSKTTGAFNRVLLPDCGLVTPGIGCIYWNAGVHQLAIDGTVMYIYTSGTFDTRLSAVNLTTDQVMWARYFNMTAAAYDLFTAGSSVFVSGGDMNELYNLNTSNDNAANIEQPVYNAVKLNSTTGAIENWEPRPVGRIYNTIKTMTHDGNNIFMGGYFSHVNGLDRTAVFALKSSTQEVLPFKADGLLFERADAIKLEGNTLYLAGDWSIAEHTVRAFNFSTGQELSWNPYYFGHASAVEANATHVFLAGNINDTTGNIHKQYLIAIDRNTGVVDTWAPNPDGIIKALHIADGKLYVGGNFTTISGQGISNIAAYDLSTLTLSAMQPPFVSNVHCIKSDDSLLYIGGVIDNFDTVSALDRFIAVRKSNGELIKYSKHAPGGNAPNGGVTDMVFKDKTVITSNNTTASSNDTCGSPFIYKGNNVMQRVNDLCIQFESGNAILNTIELVGNDLYYGGSFQYTNSNLLGTNIGRITFPTGYFNSLSVQDAVALPAGISLYPNPATDELAIQWKGTMNADVQVNIIDQPGRVMMTGIIPASNGTARINISQLAPGMYYLVAGTDSQKQTVKFIKQ